MPTFVPVGKFFDGLACCGGDCSLVAAAEGAEARYVGELTEMKITMAAEIMSDAIVASAI